MARRMSAGMQGYNIGRMLAGTRWDSEVFDVNAHIDRSLHYDENARNIRSILGIQTRDRNAESLEIRKAEQQRARVQRQDPNRLTGRIQNEHNREIDRRYQAQRPGKRFSASGRRYYERRENRADRGKYL